MDNDDRQLEAGNDCPKIAGTSESVAQARLVFVEQFRRALMFLGTHLPPCPITPPPKPPWQHPNDFPHSPAFFAYQRALCAPSSLLATTRCIPHMVSTNEKHSSIWQITLYILSHPMGLSNPCTKYFPSPDRPPFLHSTCGSSVSPTSATPPRS